MTEGDLRYHGAHGVHYDDVSLRGAEVDMLVIRGPNTTGHYAVYVQHGRPKSLTAHRPNKHKPILKD